MKKKYKLLICLFSLNSLNQTVLSNNLESRSKFISKPEYNNPYQKGDFFSLFKIEKFIKHFVANLEDSNKNQFDKLSDLEIFSDTQTNFQDKFVAEGNVLIKSNNAILKADYLEYEKKLKIFYLKGNIDFKINDQFFTASEIKYDLRNKKGFLIDIYGTVNLSTLGKLQINKNNKREKFSEDSLKNKAIKKVIYDDSGTVGFSPKRVKFDFDKIQKSRFRSDKIIIENDEWLSEKIILTNDPFNNPQLFFNNRDVKIIKGNEDLVITSKWSSLVLDNSAKLPLGRRKIKTNSKKNNLRWGLGYDKSSYDGVYIKRNSDSKYFFDRKVELNLSKSFFLQRALSGKTSSFSRKNDSVLAKKVKQNTKTLDYFGLNADLKTKIFDFDFITDISLNSLDLDKFNKAFSSKSKLSKVLSQEKTEDYDKETELSFFGNYRETIWNGSLGQREILGAYGIKLEKNKYWLDNNVIKSSNLAAGYGYYESSARGDASEIINSKRLNISLERRHSYPIWSPNINNNITSDYVYTPIPVKKGLNFNAQTNFDFFRYDDYYFQNLYTFKAGPELTLGNFKNKFFDYTQLSIYPKLTLARGESPFGFDQSSDNHSLEINLEQQLIGPLTLKANTEYNLDINSGNYKEFYNTSYILGWNRRAYKIGLFYNQQSRSGGLNFKIHSFNFDGLGNNFN